ncbi:MAG: hypothetical protein CMO81_05400 [Waddliaceae bacterium]|nr:hypothetical protein [Waddliaceae bacterium]
MSFPNDLVRNDAVLSRNEIQENVWAVHATNFLPEDGVIQGLNVITIGKESYSGSYRPFVHWTLGALVPSHGLGTWESQKYAVVIPFTELEPQLVNIFPYDTVTVGDFSLSEKKATLITREELNTPYPYANVVVLQSDETLRGAIDKVLTDNSAWHVDLENNAKHISPARVLARNEINLSEMKHWESFLEEKPYLSFGPVIHSWRGDYSKLKRMGLTVDLLVIKYLYCDKNLIDFRHIGEISKSDLEMISSVFKLYIEKTENLRSQYVENIEQGKVIIDAIQQIELWIKLIEEDNAYRKEYFGRSLVNDGLENGSAEICSVLKEWENNPDFKPKWKEPSGGLFSSRRDSMRGDSRIDILGALLPFHLNEIDEVFNKVPLEGLDLALVKLGYFMQKYLEMGPSAMMAQKISDLIEGKELERLNVFSSGGMGGILPHYELSHIIFQLYTAMKCYGKTPILERLISKIVDLIVVPEVDVSEYIRNWKISLGDEEFFLTPSLSSVGKSYLAIKNYVEDPSLESERLLNDAYTNLTWEYESGKEMNINILPNFLALVLWVLSTVEEGSSKDIVKKFLGKLCEERGRGTTLKNHREMLSNWGT